MALLSINERNFEENISSKSKALAYFWADWCGYCKLMSPLVEIVANENPDFIIGKINVDEEEELRSKYEVETYPTLLLLENGEVKDRIIARATKAQIEQLMK